MCLENPRLEGFDHSFLMTPPMWVGGGHVQRAVVWLREDFDIYTECRLLKEISFVSITEEVTQFEVYEL